MFRSALFQFLWQRQAVEPVEKVIGQRVDLHSVRVIDPERTADIRHVKTVFALLDEILHASALPRMQKKQTIFSDVESVFVTMNVLVWNN